MIENEEQEEEKKVETNCLKLKWLCLFVCETSKTAQKREFHKTCHWFISEENYFYCWKSLIRFFSRLWQCFEHRLWISQGRISPGKIVRSQLRTNFCCLEGFLKLFVLRIQQFFSFHLQATGTWKLLTIQLDILGILNCFNKSSKKINV